MKRSKRFPAVFVSSGQTSAGHLVAGRADNAMHSIAPCLTCFLQFATLSLCTPQPSLRLLQLAGEFNIPHIQVLGNLRQLRAGPTL